MTTGRQGKAVGLTNTATCGNSSGAGAPRMAPGDRLVTYAVGSQRTFGKGRVFSLLEVTSEPEPGEHERWSWIVGVRYLASVPLLSLSPTLDDIGVSPMSVR